MQSVRFGLRLARWAGLLAALALPAAAYAHEGHPPTPDHLWSAWTLEPAVVFGLAFAAWAYQRGLARLSRRPGSPPYSRRARLAFYGGLAAVFVALVSPVDSLGLALFSGHMAQHTLLMLVAAPLLALGQPAAPMLLGLPDPLLRGLGRLWARAAWLRPASHVAAGPAAAWALHAIALWAWHAPPLYEAALRSELVHALEHLSFFGTAVLFWWAALGPAAGRGSPGHGLGHGLAILYLFTMAVVSGTLGALITFSPRPWYAAHLDTTAAWGLTPLADQQLAGAIMWVPAGVVYVAAALALFGGWLAAVERRARESEG
jgi:cytochrome c oxidase assembly factor CtaG